MEAFFINLKVGVLTPYKHGFNKYILRQDGVILVQDPISLELTIFALSTESAIEKFME